MTDDEIRIMLAEVVGWTPGTGNRVGWWLPPGCPQSSRNWHNVDELPDPLTDANDDYAILEHARNNGTDEQFKAFVAALEIQQKNQPWGPATYILGDYGRAYHAAKRKKL